MIRRKEPYKRPMYRVAPDGTITFFKDCTINEFDNDITYRMFVDRWTLFTERWQSNETSYRWFNDLEQAKHFVISQQEKIIEIHKQKLYNAEQELILIKSRLGKKPKRGD